MNHQNIIERISRALLQLEDQGEIVLTSTNPDRISRAIYHTAIKELISDSELNGVLIECDIPHLLTQTSDQLTLVFKVDSDEAERIVDSYYQVLLRRMSPAEVAELIWHETPFEIALLSYYCIKLKKQDARDFEYISWRKQYYAGSNSQNST